MSVPTLSITKTFSLIGTPTIEVKDTTDWGALNLSLIDECFTLSSPIGVFHNNTDFYNPDFNRDYTDTYSNNLPLQSGQPYQGTYLIQQRVRVQNEYETTAFGANTVVLDAAEGNVTEWATAQSTIIVPSGNNAGTYTVVSSVFAAGQTTITVAETLPSPGAETITITLLSVLTANYTSELCYQYPAINIQQIADCTCGSLTSQDITNYNISNCGGMLIPTVLDRVHTVIAPNGQNGQPVIPNTVTSLATSVIVPAWTKIWTTTITTTLSYTLQDDTIVNLIVSGSKNIDVVCDEALCCAQQCLVNLQNMYYKYKGINPTLAAKYESQLFDLHTAYMLYSIAVNCGNAAQKQAQLNIIKSIASTNCDCGCGDDTNSYPVQLVPPCNLVSINGNAVVVVSAGNGTTVTSNTVGGTVTYTVGLDTDIVNSLIQQYLQQNPQSFAGLSDTSIVNPTLGQMVKYNSVTDKWENFTLTLNDLASINNLTAGDSLVWSGTAWINQNLQNQNKALTLYAYNGIQGLVATGSYTDAAHTLALATGNNPLSANGDVLEIETTFRKTAVQDPQSRPPVDMFCAVSLIINGVNIGWLSMPNGATASFISVRTRIVRISATQINVFADSWVYYIPKTGGEVAVSTGSVGGGMVIPKAVTIANLGTTGLSIVPALLTTSTLPLPTQVLTHKIISIKK